MPMTHDPDDAWLNTANGRAFYPFRPTANMVDIDDIARGLSNMCRYAGHVLKFYSVAEHSVLVSQAVELLGGNRMEQLWGLLHDASEAYLVDIPSPIKHHPQMAFYREVEKRVMDAVCLRFELPPTEPSIVTRCDQQLLCIEAPQLITKMAQPWGLPEPMKELGEVRIRCERPLVAELAFKSRFEELTS